MSQSVCVVLLSFLVAINVGIIPQVLSQTDINKMKNEELSMIMIAVPLDGLESNERLCAEIAKEGYTIIQSEINPSVIQKKVKAILKPLWGDLSHTGLVLKYTFAGINDKLATSISITTPDGKSILFIFNNGKKFPLATVSITGFNPSDKTEIIGFGFSETGFLSELTYANQRHEMIKKMTKWDKNGKFISSEPIKKPLPLNFKIEK